MLPTLLNKQGLWFDEFDTFFRSLSQPVQHTGGYSPQVDIREDENAIYLEADLPGLSKKEIKVTIDDNILSISGTREDVKESEDQIYRYERKRGAFERRFSLDDRVDTSKVDAQFKNGVLSLTLPKKEESKPKVLDIKVS